jgi:8-oxo-dGTP diphosphatase
MPPNGGTLTENPEVAGFRWIRESDVSSMMSEAYAIRVLDAYQYNAVPSVRNHDGARLVVPAAN